MFSIRYSRTFVQSCMFVAVSLVPLTASKCHENVAQFLAKQKEMIVLHSTVPKPPITNIAKKIKVSRSAVSKIIKN